MPKRTDGNEVAVIGGGPTGATLANLLSRRGTSCDLFEAHRLGGQFSWSYDWQVTNTPGQAISLPDMGYFQDGFPKLKDIGGKLANSLQINPSVNVICESVLRVDYTPDFASVVLSEDRSIKYGTIYVCCGRRDRQRKICLGLNDLVLDPYRDIGCDISEPCYVVGSGATAVDCSVELALNGHKVFLLINKPINYVPRPNRTTSVAFSLKHWEKQSVRYISGKVLSIKKRAWLQKQSPAIQTFFDASTNTKSIVMNDMFIDLISTKSIEIFLTERQPTIPRNALIFNCSGYADGGTPVECVVHTERAKVYRVGGAYQRHQPWLYDCQRVCSSVIKAVYCEDIGLGKLAAGQLELVSTA